MSGDSCEESVAKSAFGDDPCTLLKVPTEFISKVRLEAAQGTELPPFLVAELPTFLRTFFLRYLAEVHGIQIQRFTSKERELVSDTQVELEVAGKSEETWPLLFDFIDLCDRFEEVGLMSIPEEAGEHEADILRRMRQVLQDLAFWAAKTSHEELATKAGDLAREMEQVSKRYRL